MSVKAKRGKTLQSSEKYLGSTELPTESGEFRELSYARTVLIKRLSRFEQYLTDSIDVNDTISCEIRLKSIEKDLEEFDRIQTRLEFMNSIEEENRLETESAYYDAISQAKKFIRSVNTDLSGNSMQSGNLKPFGKLGKLPDLGLPSFFGSCETWFSFKSIFDSVVHKRTDLSDTEKLLYLKLCCKGDALKLIDSIDIMPENYSIALNLLQKRYENKKVVVKFHVKNILFNLPNANKESATAIRKLVDTVHQHIAALEKLKLPVDKWDPLLNTLILSKLDDNTNREWERTQYQNECPTTEQLLDFLTEKCFTLESSSSFSRLQSHKYDKGTTEIRNQEKRIGFSYGNHLIYQCPRFTQLSVSERYEEVRKHKLCSNCLRVGHRKQECKSSGCKKCNQTHNTALHYEKRQGDERAQSLKNDSKRVSSVPAERKDLPKGTSSMTATQSVRKEKCFGSTERPRLTSDQNDDDGNESVDYSLSLASASLGNNQVLLSTAIILIVDERGNWHKCNALLDSGSQSNLISESLCKKLNLGCKKIQIPLSGISQVVTKINKQTSTKIKSRFNNFSANLTFLVLPTLTENLPLFKFSKSLLKVPTHINLADEKFNEPKQIDVLLGVDIFYDLLGSGKIRLGNKLPILQETSLGWVISGNLEIFKTRTQKTVCNLSTRISNKMLHDSLTKFWHVEEFEESKILSKEETYCEEYFTQTTTRDKDNNFIVRYPFKYDVNLGLGDSKTIALKRLMYLEKKLAKNEELKKQYVDFMAEYEALGHMTRQGSIEDDDSLSSKSYFLPHSAVVKNSITTKCRVVFDASCKTTTGISLNDTLMVGPVVQDELYAILLRLRLRKTVLSADIKMMYRCIKIEENEREFQKILWRSNGKDPVEVYKLNTVTYGTSSAPFQATRCLVELAEQNMNIYPRTSEIIKRSFYMDDLLVSVDSEAEAWDIYQELNEIMNQANFKLRKWSSNSGTVLKKILKSNDNENLDSFILSHNEKELKTLGISWDPEQDILKYTVKVKLDATCVTKRTILSTISEIFDPLGLIGPAMIRAKLIIQSLWKLQLDWDQEVPKELRQLWQDFAAQLECLNECKVDRHVILGNAIRITLFGFSDSSEKAYGACIYVGSIDDLGNHNLRLLTGKSRVAPVKKLTLPRLELLAAHLLAKLMDTMKRILDIPISHVKYFTDSKIVLAWIKIEPSNLKTFVANRVAKITELSKEENWAHVPSKDNPADVISRGLSPKELLQCELWFHGPNFLRESQSQMVIESENEEISLDRLPELKTNSSVENKIMTHASIDKPTFDIFSRFSTLFKLRRIVAYIWRFKEQSLTKTKNTSSCLTVEELNEAQRILIKLAQRDTFHKEIKELHKNNKVASDSKILSLNPFLDSVGIIRVGGRLTNSDCRFDQRHPVILAYKHKFTDLVIMDEHMKHLHAGVQNLLSIIRLQYWIVNGKNAIKTILSRCIRCFKVKPKPLKFLMGSLPAARVTPSRPFSNCGIDYAGPILVKEGTLRRSKRVKTYICIFVCFATRAIHIELVRDLSTVSFLNALDRFCSRRGKPTDIYSDNGSNFVGANNHFLELQALLNNKLHVNAVSTHLANDQIRWHFLPARSAHMGGLWEAAVKSTKFHLRRVLGDSALAYEEMYTLLVKIEACLNSRPLTPTSNDINDYLPLTPAHFLIGDSLVSPPQHDVRDSPISQLSRYERVQQLQQQFWSNWVKDYLASLQNRSKWKKSADKSIEIGSLVLLVEDNLPPLRWSLARVVQLHKGKDNVIRVVTVRLPNGTISKRTVSKICPLPTEGKGPLSAGRDMFVPFYDARNWDIYDELRKLIVYPNRSTRCVKVGPGRQHASAWRFWHSVARCQLVLTQPSVPDPVRSGWSFNSPVNVQ
ncbi:uncharacterized protein, partial [Euwallacea fornicatus]|uniref:uncharacterized protein n=1 Tax=Euwallacea fornicatus TaxID=995702 RepID=UPI00338EBF7C